MFCAVSLRTLRQIADAIENIFLFPPPFLVYCILIYVLFTRVRLKENLGIIVSIILCCLMFVYGFYKSLLVCIILCCRYLNLI